MIYSFNYSALPKFWRDKGLSKKDIMKAFGNTDYVTINKWLDGKVAISIPHILKFCNHFQLPPTYFFSDEEGLPLAFKKIYRFQAENGNDHQTVIYNFSIEYLKKFMADYKLDKKDLLEAFGTYDYTTLNKTLVEDRPMVTVPLLRLCNYYQIPISNFFIDQFGNKYDIEPFQPATGDMLLPNMPIPDVRERGMGVIETKVTERKPRSAAQTLAINSGEDRRQLQLNNYAKIRRNHPLLNDMGNNENYAIDKNYLINFPPMFPFGPIISNGDNEDKSLLLDLTHRLSMKEDECNKLVEELDKTKRELELLKKKILIFSSETAQGFASLLNTE